MYIVGEADRAVIVTVRLALRPSEANQLRLALQTDKFHIDVRMGNTNAEIVRIEDASPMDKVRV